jgi:tetratricopeptide (TPR) repeat protein
MKTLILLLAFLPMAMFAQQSPDESAYRSKIDQLSKQIQTNPNSPDLYVQRAEQVFMLNAIYPNQKVSGYTLSHVLTDMDRAIELNPTSPLLYSTRGEYKRDINGDLAGAQADLTKAIELDPKNPTWYVNRSNYKSLDGACMDWKKCADLGNGKCKQMRSELCNNK